MEGGDKQEQKLATLPQKKNKLNKDPEVQILDYESLVIFEKEIRYIKNPQNGGIASGYHFGATFGASSGSVVMHDSINDSPKPDAGNATAKNNESGKSKVNINQNPNRLNQIKNSDQGQGQVGHGNPGGQGVQQQGGGQDGNHGLGVRGVTAAGGQLGGPGGALHKQWDNKNRSGQRSGGPAGTSGGGGGPGGGRGGEDFFIAQRLLSLAGPTLELPPVEIPAESKFSGRNRLYVGNLSKDTTDDELREMFKPYGEIDDIFHNSFFAFLKVDYHSNAEKAKSALDGSMHRGRQLRVRFAPPSTTLRVSNLTQYVTNELLHKSFEIFGPLERAIITVDERGRHTGEGVVEFVKKSSALACLRLCNAKCFLLTASSRPCLVEPMDVTDDNDGLPEKSISRNTPDFVQERSIGPRFADRNSFEHEYGSRWKQLHYLFKTKHDALKRQLKMEEEKLEAQVEYARYDQETELLRQELRKREVNFQHKKLKWELHESQIEDMRKREDESMLRLQGEMQNNMTRQEVDIRRRQQENTMHMQGFGGDGENVSSAFQVFGDRNSTIVGNDSGAGGGQWVQDPFTLEFWKNNVKNVNQFDPHGGGGGGGGLF